MAEPGAVAWQFQRLGQVYVDGSADEDAVLLVALDAGADDVAKDEEGWLVTCPPAQLHVVVKALQEAEMGVSSSELALVPVNTITIEYEGDAKKIIRLVETLDDHDDVQNVWSNFDIPDSMLAALDE
ncbi:MAG: YebC/PmpR family DNA-binding transcriptional regulator, partial [Acidimicrobiales bacterium]